MLSHTLGLALLRNLPGVGATSSNTCADEMQTICLFLNGAVMVRCYQPETKQMLEQKATEWVNSYGDMLYRYALPRVSDSEVAKDLVQETFLAAWRNIANFKGEISEKNWLFTILKNKIIDHYRKAVNRLTDSIPGIADEDPYFEEGGHWAKGAYPREWGIDYNNNIESKEFFEVLEQCKSKLKEMQNAVFTMKYLEGMESEEICKALNITPSNYWVLLHRAKVQLRGCLEKNWFTS